jgi:Holliday junction resolvasome RuvABC endonuclease subunit
MNFIGIDPGVAGGIAIIRKHDAGIEIETFKLKDATERDVWDFIAGNDPGFAIIEAVHSSPQMGVVSAFTFGRSFGLLRGLLIAAGIPFETARPQAWQKAMGCLSKGDKNVTKAKAQELHPSVKITHANADALLLANYALMKFLTGGI